MKAVQLYGVRDLRIDDVPKPAPGPGEALIRVRAVGVCGSDVHYYVDGKIGSASPEYPFTLGHEFAGEIAALGEGADGPPVGTPVAVDPAIPCGECEICLEGNVNCCPNVRFPGSPPIGGTLQEYYVHPAHLCEPISESLSFADGAMLEPLGVGIHAASLAKVDLSDQVAILGAGPIGLLTLQLAKRSGAQAVYVTEPIPERRSWAMRLGAADVCDPEARDPAEWILEVTDGRGVDVAIETAWGGDAVDQAVHMARPAGRVVLVGIPREDVVTYAAGESRRKGLTILMSRRMKPVYHRAVPLVDKNLVDVRSMVTHRFPLERTAEAFELVAELSDGVVKAMIEL